MRSIRRVIWGVVLLAAAMAIALNSFNIIDFDLFFEGWWTLFIIVPALAGIISDRDKSGAICWFCIGVLLLLCEQNIISWNMIWKIALPLIIAIIGFKMIFSEFRKSKRNRIIREIKIEGGDLQNGVAVFCGTDLNFDNVVFDGANLVAVFGGVDCDLSNAIIDRDCVINVACVFGGIDIKVPDNVKVVSNVSCVFGGIDVNKNDTEAIHTLYIDGVCVFGGMDVN